MTQNDIGQKLWNLCDVLRDDGINYSDYVTVNRPGIPGGGPAGAAQHRRFPEPADGSFRGAAC